MTIRGVLGGIGCALIGLFGAMVIASIISMACASKAHGQTYHWRDRARLEALADSAGINRKAVLAIIWEESAGNDSTPSVRGHYCWWTKAQVYDPRLDVTDTVSLADVGRFVRNGYTVTKKIVHHEKNCEVGRMQIKPSTARLRCPGKDIFTYEGNLSCFAKMFAEDAQIGGTLSAIRHHNGSGPRADAYVKRVLQTIGWLTVTEGI